MYAFAKARNRGKQESDVDHGLARPIMDNAPCLDYLRITETSSTVAADGMANPIDTKRYVQFGCCLVLILNLH